MTVRYFVEPLDVLVLRGNKLFGDPGSFGESYVPPWPSVAAGAFRSALMVERGYDLEAFARGEIDSDSELGTPSAPGTFTVTGFTLAQRHAECAVVEIEQLHPVPNDLAVWESGSGKIHARRIGPVTIEEEISSSASTAQHAVLPQSTRGKLSPGHWLTGEGWRAHLGESDVDPVRHLRRNSDLWALDNRTGIALDPTERSASDGALFTSEAVALRKPEHAANWSGDGSDGTVGFVVDISGVDEQRLPDSLTLRLGGDGRAAIAKREDSGGTTDFHYGAISEAGRCRMILITPGLFADGWLPTGVKASGTDIHFELHGVEGRLVCAAVPRAEVVSGFDIARRRPKPAQRVAPAGSVYWLDDLRASPQALRKLAEHGLWSEPAENEARRAEGFNRLAFATWSD